MCFGSEGAEISSGSLKHVIQVFADYANCCGSEVMVATDEATIERSAPVISLPGTMTPAQRVTPGLLLAIAIAVVAVQAEPLIGGLLDVAAGISRPIPSIIIALCLGIGLHSFARHEIFAPGLDFAIKTLLRFAIALLGLRIALGDIVGLGWRIPLLVLLAMIATLTVGLGLARLLRLSPHTGALAGMAVSVCGASATLATSTVLGNYPGKERDVAFAVVSANAFSTLAMVLYPVLATFVGLNDYETGVLIGASIHDMAQVVGAGYAVSPETGDTAVIVKLFRVFMLLPMVVLVGVLFNARIASGGQPRVPIPGFAVAFVLLCLLNSVMPVTGAVGAVYGSVHVVAAKASSWGLLIAIAALGLGTSLRSLLTIGWRHIIIFMGASAFIVAVIAASLKAASIF
jgi:uncharacterized integral membrane protein (TIGR00698 family)